MVNPFYDKDAVENTSRQCGIIHFDINDGFVDVAKSKRPSSWIS